MSFTKNTLKSHLFSIHIAVLLFGLAGIFGKLITLPAVIIVWGRVTFASLALGILIRKNRNQRLALSEKKAYGRFFLLGALLAFHWFSFFYAIQLSTVAIALLSFASFPIFTAMIEPWFSNEIFDAKFLVLALISSIGIFLVIPEFSFSNSHTLGIVWGLLSGLSFAFLTILNKRFVHRFSALKITFYQDLFACLLLTPFLFILQIKFSLENIFLLLLLGTVFTAFAHFLYIRSLQSIKARTASIISGLEPVYGVLFAVILLDEIPSWRTVFGGMIILGAALYLSLDKGN